MATTRSTTTTNHTKTGTGSGRTGSSTTASGPAGAGPSRNEIRKPLHASVGAGDFAVEKLRELPSVYTTEVKRLRGAVSGLQGQVKELPEAWVAQARELPGQVKASLSGLSERATGLYDDFAARGERVVTRVRRSPAVQDAAHEASVTAREAKATRTSAGKTVRAAEKAVEDTAHKIG